MIARGSLSQKDKNVTQAYPVSTKDRSSATHSLENK